MTKVIETQTALDGSIVSRTERTIEDSASPNEMDGARDGQSPPGPAPPPGPGALLFDEVVTTVRKHYYFDADWPYIIVALFVFQAYIARRMPAVFYLFFAGAIGSGKTNILDLLCKLTHGWMFQNVSVAALARVIEDVRAVFIDELDETKGKEVDEIMNALLRQGYKRTAAPYLRWNAVERGLEVIPIYGPKAATYRGALDDALTSRGFPLGTAKPVGAAGYALVIRNFYPEINDLPERLARWGDETLAAWDDAKVQAIIESPELREKVKAVVEELGANRETELMVLAVAVAEIIGIDTLFALREASEAQTVAMAIGEREDVEGLRDILADLGERHWSANPSTSELQVHQRVVKGRLDMARRNRGLRASSSGEFSRIRRDAGITDGMLTHPKGSACWHISRDAYLRILRRDLVQPHPPHQAHPDAKVDEVGHVGQVDLNRAYSEGDPGDLFGGAKTRADRAREALRSESRSGPEDGTANSPPQDPAGPPLKRLPGEGDGDTAARPRLDHSQKDEDGGDEQLGQGR